MIVGARGGLGSIAIQYAQDMGIHIIAVDGGSEKGEPCKLLGAANYVDFKTSKSVVEGVKTASGEDRLGPHAVLLLVPNEQPFLQATQHLRSHGTVLLIAMPAAVELKISAFDSGTHGYGQGIVYRQSRGHGGSSRLLCPEADKLSIQSWGVERGAERVWRYEGQQCRGEVRVGHEQIRGRRASWVIHWKH